MPKIKTKREDVLRPNEIETMCKSANQKMACLIALLWIFGKRISENIQLKRKDLWIDEEYLYVRFNVLKKKHRKEDPTPHFFLKRKTVHHAFVKYVRVFLDEVKNPESFLFSSTRSSSGYISRQHALNQLKVLNPLSWCHLFRHSLATYMAEHGATVLELMNWFDWEDEKTAIRYVKRGTRFTKKWSDATY